MTKYDYLTKLKHYLQPLPTKERNAAMKYYEKYFNDAGPENERYVIMNLGSPKQLADKILSKSKHTFSGMMHETRKNVKNAQKQMNDSNGKKSIAYTVIMVPLLVIFIILFILTFAIFALCVSGILVLIAAAGVMLLCMSVPYMMSLTSVAFVVLGVSLVLIGLPILFFMPAMNFVFWVIKKSVSGTFAFVNKHIKGKAAIKQ